VKELIGETFLTQRMYAYVTTGTHSDERVAGLDDPIDTGKPTILMTSLFHPREVATLQMSMYIYLKLIYLFYRNDTDTKYLLETSQIAYRLCTNLE
jgi:hypothetical protein